MYDWTINYSSHKHAEHTYKHADSLQVNAGNVSLQGQRLSVDANDAGHKYEKTQVGQLL